MRSIRFVTGAALALWPAAVIGNIISLTVDLDAPDPSSPVQTLSGLSAQAIFTFDTNNPTELRIELKNTSTGLPAFMSDPNASQLLTAISFDFGAPGANAADPALIGGFVVIGPGGYSIGFDHVASQLGSGDDVTGEWGYGNTVGSGMLANHVSVMTSHTTSFGGSNLTGPVSLDGPEAGIATDPPLTAVGGLGAVADSVVIHITLDAPLADLDFLADNGVRAEFGSDAAYLIPEPGTLSLLLIAGVVAVRRRLF